MTTTTHSEEEFASFPLLYRMTIQGGSHLFQQLNIPNRLLIIGWVFVVNIQPVQAIIFHNLQRTRDELGPQRWVDNDRVERRRVRRTSNAQEDFEVAVGFL